MYRPQIHVASGNTHKIQEISEILRTLADVSGVSEMPAVEETESTFIGNARLKAMAVKAVSGAWVLADDSGLEVDALDGEPGVWSARYAGEGATDAQNRAKLLAELKRVDASYSEQRKARFRCVLVLISETGAEEIFEGSCEGTLALEERGEGGFGYDPLFIPTGFEQTFAQLPARIKNELSHRGKALSGLRAWLEELNS